MNAALSSDRVESDEIEDFVLVHCQVMSGGLGSNPHRPSLNDSSKDKGKQFSIGQWERKEWAMQWTSKARPPMKGRSSNVVLSKTVRCDSSTANSVTPSTWQADRSIPVDRRHNSDSSPDVRGPWRPFRQMRAGRMWPNGCEDCAGAEPTQLPRAFTRLLAHASVHFARSQYLIDSE